MNEQVVQTLEALTPAAEARAARRLNILLGLVPLSEMTQAETDWVFRAKVRQADD
jgi:hypothetical protein